MTKICGRCGYFIEHQSSMAYAEPFWSHTSYSPTRPTGPPCDHAEPVTCWEPGDSSAFSSDESVGLPEGVHETVLINGDQTIPVTLTVHPDGTHEIKGRP